MKGKKTSKEKIIIEAIKNLDKPLYTKEGKVFKYYCNCEESKCSKTFCTKCNKEKGGYINIDFFKHYIKIKEDKDGYYLMLYSIDLDNLKDEKNILASITNNKMEFNINLEDRLMNTDKKKRIIFKEKDESDTRDMFLYFLTEVLEKNEESKKINEDNTKIISEFYSSLKMAIKYNIRFSIETNKRFKSIKNYTLKYNMINHKDSTDITRKRWRNSKRLYDFIHLGLIEEFSPSEDPCDTVMKKLNLEDKETFEYMFKTCSLGHQFYDLINLYKNYSEEAIKNVLKTAKVFNQQETINILTISSMIIDYEQNFKINLGKEAKEEDIQKLKEINNSLCKIDFDFFYINKRAKNDSYGIIRKIIYDNLTNFDPSIILTLTLKALFILKLEDMKDFPVNKLVAIGALKNNDYVLKRKLKKYEGNITILKIIDILFLDIKEQQKKELINSL